MYSIEKFSVLISLYNLIILQYICYAKLTVKAPFNAQKQILNNNDSSEYNFLITGGYRPSEATLTKYLISIRTYEHNIHRCGGSIISPKVILTAAHCVCKKHTAFRMMPQEIFIVAGSSRRLDDSNSTEYLKVRKIIKHENYDINLWGNDIALLILAKRLTENGVTIQSINLGTSTPPANTECTVVGWGTIYEMGPWPNEALYVDITIFEKSYCRSYVENLHDGTLCAGHKDDERDSCNGDSGGPLICNGNVSGIVSFGTFVCGMGPGFYTDVSYYIDWIRKNGCSKFLPRKKFILVLSTVIVATYSFVYGYYKISL